MSLTHKCLLVDIFLTRSLSKSLAFYEFASINFEPWLSLSICLGGQWNSTLSLLDFFPYIEIVFSCEVCKCQKLVCCSSE